MTAQPHDVPSGPLAKTPRAIRAALSEQDAVLFDQQFLAAMADATESYDLTVVQACLERWWRTARLCGDPTAYQRARDHADAVTRGADIPTVPWERLRRSLGA